MKKTFIILLSLVLIYSSLLYANGNKNLKIPSANVFIENKGQWDSSVRFLAKTNSMNVWITDNSVVYDFYKTTNVNDNTKERNFYSKNFDKLECSGHIVNMKFTGSSNNSTAIGKNLQSGYYNYLNVDEPDKNITFVPLYSEVVLKDLYAGISTKFYFDDGSIRYDIITDSGANPEQIKISFEGADKLYINKNGELVISTHIGDVLHQKLFAYQEGKDINKVSIPCNFKIVDDNKITFALGEYNQNLALVIDPLIYSTYIGSTVEFPEKLGFALDSDGNVYMGGVTYSSKFPTTPGAYDTSLDGSRAVFVTKLNATGTGLVYSTFIESQYGIWGSDLAIDASQCAYITGSKGDGLNENVQALAVKLNAQGSNLDYLALVGDGLGYGLDSGVGIAVDKSGSAYITGSTQCKDSECKQLLSSDNVFISKISASGGIEYFNVIGGDNDDEATDIAVGPGGPVVIGITYLSSNPVVRNFPITGGYYEFDKYAMFIYGSGFSTLMGGVAYYTEEVADVYIDSKGYIYVTGMAREKFYTTSGSYNPGPSDGYDAFVVKLGGGGNIIFSTLLAGSDQEVGGGITTDLNGQIYVVGWTSSSNFPTTPGTFDNSYSGNQDLFISKLNSTGTTLLYSTYLGGFSPDWAKGIRVDKNGDVYVTGETRSSMSPADFPTTPGAFDTTPNGGYDAVVAKLEITSNPDLFIAKDDLKLSPVGLDLKIDADIHNDGPAKQSVEVIFIEENLETQAQKIIATEVIPNIEKNNFITLSKTFTPSKANLLIRVIIDMNNKIPETDETNNTAEIEFKRPEVKTITAKYDREKDPDVFGRFMSGLEGTVNTFYATATEDITKKVEFKLNGNIITDTTPGDGWSAEFDMGKLPAGDNILTVTAYNELDIPSFPAVKIVRVREMPDWMKVNLNLWDIVNIKVNESYISFTLNFSLGGSKGGGPFDYVLKINKAVDFIPKKSISIETSLILNAMVPLDPTLGWSITGKLSATQTILDKELGKNEGVVSVFLNPDNTLNSVLLGYEKEALLFSLEKEVKYPLVPGLNAVISAGFDISGRLKIQLVTGMREGSAFKFVVTPDGKKTALTPGLTLQFNLAGGVEIVYGLVSAELVLSPSFSMDIGVTYVTYPDNEGMQLFAEGSGKVKWKVIGSAFWGALEQEFYSGTFGPWQLFDTSGKNSIASKFNVLYSDTVQLPTQLPLPDISTDDNGNIMVAWLQKDGNTPQIYYSHKTLTTDFSTPQHLINNNFYKSDPSISFHNDGTVSAIWIQNSKDSTFANTNPTLSEILRYQDIYYSKWNKTSWSTPKLITPETQGNELSDGVPTVIVSSTGNKLILWTRNKSTNSLDRAGLEIYYSKSIDDTTFSSPNAITSNTSADLMVRGAFYDGTNAIAVWLRDEDANPETINDFDIYYSRWNGTSWNSATKLTNNLNQEKGLSIAPMRNGKVIASWVEMSMLPDSSFSHILMSSVYDPSANSWTNPEIVYQSSHFIEDPIVKVDQRNIATITYRGYDKSVNGDILIALKDFNSGTLWTQPKTITSDDLIDWMIATAIDASNNQHFVNLKSLTSSTRSNYPSAKVSNFYGGLHIITKGIQPNGTIGDNLNTGTYKIAPDLYVDSSSINVVASTLREYVPTNVSITIKNKGGIASNSTIVRAYKNDPRKGGTKIGTDLTLPSLLADSSATLNFTYTFTGADSIYIWVDPTSTIDEQSENNNIAYRFIKLLPDIVVDSVKVQFATVPKINDIGTIKAYIRNIGQKKAQNITVRFLTGTSDTTLSTLADSIFVEAMPDSKYVITRPYEVMFAGKHYIKVHSDPTNTISEIKEDNNYSNTSFEVLPDISVDALWYDFNLKKVKVVISNIGGYEATNFETKIYNGEPLLNGMRIGSIATNSLLVGEKDTLELSYSSSVGLSNIQCWVDSANVVNELSKHNNRKGISIITTGVPDFTPKFIMAESTFVVNSQIPIVVKMTNIGTKGYIMIPYKITMTNMAGGPETTIKTGVLQTLNPQISQIDTTYFSISNEMTVKFKVTIDYDKSIPEINENNNVDSVFVKIVKTTSITRKDRINVFPTEFKLSQNYPNPFNPETVISYQLPVIGNQSSYQSPITDYQLPITDYRLPITNYQLPITDYHVNLSIYSITGQLIRTLVNEAQTPGYYSVKWDGRDDNGKEVSSGLYIYAIKAGEFRATKRMVMVK